MKHLSAQKSLPEPGIPLSWGFGISLWYDNHSVVPLLETGGSEDVALYYIPADACPVEISQLLSDLSTETKWKEKNPKNLPNKQKNHKKKQTKPNKTLKNLKTNKKPFKKL